MLQEVLTMQNFISIAAVFATVLTTAFYGGIKLGHTIDVENAIPKWWRAIIYVAFFFTAILLSSFILSKNEVSLNQFEKGYASKRVVQKLFKIQGIAVKELMMNEVEAKFFDIENSSKKNFDVKEDLKLLQISLYKIIWECRDYIADIDVLLPSGKSLDQAMNDAYEKDEFNQDFKQITSMVFKKNISKREKMRTIEDFITTRQRELYEEVIENNYPTNYYSKNNQ